ELQRCIFALALDRSAPGSVTTDRHSRQATVRRGGKAPQGLVVGHLLDALGEEFACQGNVLFSVVLTTKLGNLSTMVCDQRAVSALSCGGLDIRSATTPMPKIRTAIMVSTILIWPAFAHDNHRGYDNDHGSHFHNAPGPIAGASLPVLA